MPDEDKNLTVGIEVKPVGDPAGEINKVTEAAGDLEGKTRKLTDAEEESTKGIKKNTGEARAKRAVFSQLDKLIPGLGTAMKVAFGASPIFIAIAAVKILHSVVEKLHKKLEEAQAEWKAHHDGAIKAKELADDYAHSLYMAKQAIDPIQKSYDLQSIALDGIIARHKLVLDEMEKQALAQANGDKVQEEAIKRRFAMLKDQYDLQAEGAKLSQKIQQEGAAREVAAQASIGAQAAQGLLQALTANAPKDIGKLEDYKKEAAKNQAEIASLPQMRARASEEYQLGGDPTSLNKEIERLQKVKDNLDRLEAYNEALKKATTLAGDTSKKSQDHNAKLEALSTEIGKGIESLKENRKTEFFKEHQSSATAHLGSAESVAALFNGKTATKSRFAGGPSDDQAALMRSIGSMAAGQNLNTQQAVNMLNFLSKHPAQQAKTLERIISIMEASADSGKVIEGRLSILEKRSGAQPGNPH